jgi:uncharacterized membrane protein YhaH (DUF805 family)
MKWYLQVLKKYADFSGRARRKEYWMFFLFNIIICIVLGIIDGVAGMNLGGMGLLGLVYSLAILVPSIAVGIRRLHDIDKSGWWVLIIFVPLIGAIVLLVFAVMAGTPGDNRFGPEPAEEPAA